MIELPELIRQVDNIITKHGGVSEGQSVLWGDVTFHFHNGWRLEQYEIKKTVGKGSTPKPKGVQYGTLGKR